MANNKDFINILRELRGSGAPGTAYTDGIYHDIITKTTDSNGDARLGAGIYGSIQHMYASIDNVITDLDKLLVLQNMSAELQSLYADKLTLDSLYADKLKLDSLFADKVKLDSIFADKLKLDSLVTDKPTLDGLYASKAAIDALFIDKAAFDSLYADKLTLDSLFSDKGTLDSLYADKTKLDRIHASIANIDSILLNIVNIDIVALAIANVNTVGSAILNVNTVSSNISSVNTIANAQNLANVVTVAGINTSISTLAAINVAISSLYADKATLDSLFADKISLDSLFADKATLDSLYADKAKLDSLFADKLTLDSLVADKVKLDRIYTSISNLDRVFTSISNLDRVFTSIGNLDTVFASIANVDITAGSIANINSVAGNAANVNNVATNMADVVTVAADLNNYTSTYYFTLAVAPTIVSHPTLKKGHLYYDSVLDELRVYNGTIWKSAGSTVNGISRTEEFIVGTASGIYDGISSTSFPLVGGYDAGFAEVVWNGYVLADGDVNVSSGITVDILNGVPVAGDIVKVIAYGAFVLADHYTKAQQDVIDVAQDTQIGLKAPQATTYTKTESDNSLALKEDITANDAKLALKTNKSEIAYNNDTTSFIANTLPSGAIIENGSNANGSYIKYADGTLVCMGDIIFTPSSLISNLFGATSGNIYRSDRALTFAYPFILKPKVCASSEGESIATFQTATNITLRVYAATAGTATYNSYIAVGRWKA